MENFGKRKQFSFSNSECFGFKKPKLNLKLSIDSFSTLISNGQCGNESKNIISNENNAESNLHSTPSSNSCSLPTPRNKSPQNSSIDAIEKVVEGFVRLSSPSRCRDVQNAHAPQTEKAFSFSCKPRARVLQLRTDSKLVEDFTLSIVPPTPSHQRSFSKQSSHLCSVDEGLYIADVHTAKNTELLQSNGITHVINCIPSMDMAKFVCSDIRTLDLDMRDRSSFDIRKYFFTTVSFIDNALACGGKVLVFCFKGISRSATIVLAFLIWKYSWTVNEALQTIRRARPQVSPNLGFMFQLYEWEKHRPSKV